MEKIREKLNYLDYRDFMFNLTADVLMVLGAVKLAEMLPTFINFIAFM